MINWIVIVNRSGFKVFEKENYNGELKVINQFDYPDGRKRSSELKSDGPGRSFNVAGQWGHAYNPEESAREHVLDQLTREVAAILNKEAYNKSFDVLYLVAEDKVLGKLRKLLDKHATEKLAKSLNKDVASMNINDLKEYVADINH